MNLIRTPDKLNDDQHTFKCEVCQLVFMTPDHHPVHHQLK